MVSMTRLFTENRERVTLLFPDNHRVVCAGDWRKVGGKWQMTVTPDELEWVLWMREAIDQVYAERLRGQG